ncbi:MAG TPA: Crp/Fnr family transcriptional regulator, partial [Bacteroidia bacterium]|nr:Crp/Fnr family transcriptional regulator [Bacteroidia bacterium]
MNSPQTVTLDFFKKYCSEEWLPLISLHQENRYFEKNEVIIHEDDPVSGIYLLNKGKVKVTSHLQTKNERILRLANGQVIIGHRGLFLKNYTISAVALTSCDLSFIPINLFFQLYKSNPAFSQFMLEFLIHELQESEEQQFMLTIDNVRQRIAFCLVKLVRTFGYESKTSKQLSFTLTRKDIAVLGNTTYESVIRTLSAFEKEKLIQCVGKNIAILNENK